MGRIERPPSWILKYKERIENGTINVDEILEEENKIREVPIKISSVTRAVNAMGHPITGMRSGTRGESGEGDAKGNVGTGGGTEGAEKGPGWLQKYRERVENGTITVEEIMEEESKIREVPIKIATVKRAINAMGYPIHGMQSGAEGEVKENDGTSGGTKGAEKGPGWLQKYRERVENGTITIDEILEEENRIREVPIKRSSVTRAVNAMGYPIIGMQRGAEGEAEESVGTRVEAKGAEKGPGWLQKYRERVENGTITIDEILEEENRIRGAPIKRSSVTRAVNAMGYPITGARGGKKSEEVKEAGKAKKAGGAGAADYSSSIGKISEETVKRFNAMKKSWEEDLGKSLHNDYYLNILLALAKLAEQGKSLIPVKREP